MNFDWTLIFGVIVIIVIIVVLFFLYNFFKLWFQALMSKANVSFAQLIGMRFRKVPARVIVEAKIMAVKAGLDLSTDALEAHFLAGATCSAWCRR